MPGTASLASSLASLPESRRQKILSRLSDEEAAALLYDWKFWARGEQLPPATGWSIWLLLAGRGFGKTRTGAEYIRSEVESAESPLRVALVAKTPSDARDVMIEGQSGLLAVSPPWNRPVYEPSKRRLTWPSGSIGTVYSSKEYDTLRGPQHHVAWGDELASWHYPQETWDNLMFGLRLGERPRVVVTTTPKRIPLVKALLDRSGRDVAVTSGSTYDNRENLPAAFFNEIVSRYEGTTLGQQEIYAKLLSDVPGALWKRARIDELRVLRAPELPRVVIAVDPSAKSTEDSAETGIIPCGIDEEGGGYVLDDDSVRASPDGWARAAVGAYYRHKADFIIAEANNGGEMVEHTINTVDPDVPVKLVHASRGKRTRAEPIAALYEQGKIHHVGNFAELEDQMCTWLPGEKSPDRMDALVWGFTELMLDGRAPDDLGIYL